MTNDKAIRSALKNLPKGIDETYVRILEKIKRDNPERILEILTLLQWVVASKRPLTVDELAQAITIELGAKYLDFDAIATNPEDILRPCSTLLVTSPVQQSYRQWLYKSAFKQLCGSELQIFQQESTKLQVGFGHFSIKEFLVSSRILKYPTVSDFFLGDSEKLEATLFAACITYLSFDDFGDPNLVKIAKEGNYPLLSYAANFWPQKLNTGQQEMLHRTLFQQNNKRANFVHWVALLDSPEFKYRKEDFVWMEEEQERDDREEHEWDEEQGQGAKVLTEMKFMDSQYQREHMVTPLMMSAHLGYDRLVELLVPLEIAKDRIHHVSVVDSYNYIALMEGLVLLDTGGIVSISTEISVKPWIIALDFAVIAGQVEGVKALLAHGRWLSATERVDTQLSCFLQFILRCWRSHSETGPAPAMVEILALLIDHGANVNAESALQHAAHLASPDIVKLLIERGADVNATGGHYGSALQAAASRGGNLDTAKLRIEYGVDVNATGGHYGSALQAAASRGGNLDTVKLRIEYGVDINATTGEYGSALQAAARYGNLDTVKILIEHGADVNATGGEYGSALQAAACEGNFDTVKLLIEHGADVNTTRGVYGSALQAATREGNLDTVKILIEHGADVNATGGKYGSALNAASKSGYSDIVELLIKHGASA